MREIVAELLGERSALRATLAEVGPDAPTACGPWTATDLAVHLVTGELLAAVPNAPFRWLVGRGVRLDRMAPLNQRALALWRQRRDFDWALRRLGRSPPWLHRIGLVAPVTLLEYWVHHEDVLAANDVGPCQAGVDLAPVLAVVSRYQREVLDRHAARLTTAAAVWVTPTDEPRVVVDGAPGDLVRWLTGRGPLHAMSVSGESGAIDALAAEHLSL